MSCHDETRKASCINMHPVCPALEVNCADQTRSSKTENSGGYGRMHGHKHAEKPQQRQRWSKGTNIVLDLCACVVPIDDELPHFDLLMALALSIAPSSRRRLWGGSHMTTACQQ